MIMVFALLGPRKKRDLPPHGVFSVKLISFGVLLSVWIRGVSPFLAMQPGGFPPSASAAADGRRRFAAPRAVRKISPKGIVIPGALAAEQAPDRLVCRMRSLT